VKHAILKSKLSHLCRVTKIRMSSKHYCSSCHNCRNHHTKRQHQKWVLRKKPIKPGKQACFMQKFQRVSICMKTIYKSKTAWKEVCLNRKMSKLLKYKK